MNTKKISAAIAALLLSASAFNAVAVQAYTTEGTPSTTVADTNGNDQITFEAVRSGENEITVNILANDSFNELDTMSCYVSYDIVFPDISSTVFNSTEFNNIEGSVKRGKVNFVGVKNAPAKDGTVASFVYALPEDFELGKDYVFTYRFDDAYNDDVDFDWNKTTYTVTYREEETVPEVYTVTFKNGETEVGTQQVEENATATAIAAPTAEAGKKFGGWSADNSTVFDFATPITENKTLYALWEDVALNTDAVDLSKVSITKNLTTNADTLPGETFTFNLEYVANSLNPDTSSARVADAAKIPQKITATITDEGTVNLGSATFPIGGVYTYKVTEAEGTNSKITYDDTVYYLVLEIEENNTGKLVLDDVIVHKDTETGEKAELEFNNKYVNTSSLTVSKTVEGEEDNPLRNNKEFTFHIKFTAPEVSGNDTISVKTGGTPYSLEYNTDYEFTLKDGDTLEFENIYENAVYVLTETGQEYYTPSAVITAGGTKGEMQNGQYAEDFTVNGTVKSGENKADVTNTYSITPPTGVEVNHGMLAVAGLIFTGMTGSFVLNRKLRRKQD